jgi:hypothetical protein
MTTAEETNLIAAISAAVSSFALVAVAIAVKIQAKQARISQHQASLTFQLELIKLAVSDPSLRTILDPNSSPEYLFRNLGHRYLRMLHHFGDVPPAGISAAISSMEMSDEARDWWSSTRLNYLLEATSRKDIEFVRIVDLCYRRDEPVAEADPDTSK